MLQLQIVILSTHMICMHIFGKLSARGDIGEEMFAGYMNLKETFVRAVHSCCAGCVM